MCPLSMLLALRDNSLRRLLHPQTKLLSHPQSCWQHVAGRSQTVSVTALLTHSRCAGAIFWTCASNLDCLLSVPQVLIFSSSKRMLKILEQMVFTSGYNYRCYHATLCPCHTCSVLLHPPAQAQPSRPQLFADRLRRCHWLGCRQPLAHAKWLMPTLAGNEPYGNGAVA